MTTIFLTGGSGEIGSVVIRELAPSHKSKTLFLNAPGTFAHPPVEWIQGDIAKPWWRTYESHLNGVKEIVHLAAQLRGGNGYTVNPEPFWEGYGIPFIDPREGIRGA